MKTLSIRQPWADLIIQGRKTLELRTWTVRYRGSLAIHASQTVERETCLAHGLDPDRVTVGAVIGIVDLVEIFELDTASYEARRAEHLADEPWGDGPLYGWRLANPRPLPEPVPTRGRMGIFEAPVALGLKSQADMGSPLQADSSQRADSRSQGTARNGNRAPAARAFELRVAAVLTPDPGAPAYRLALFQRSVEPPPDQKGLYEPEPPATHKVAELGGSTLRAVADHVMEALRTNGYKPTELGAGRREPFALAEETGVRLGLLFLAVRPITKVERIEIIAQGIRSMTSEEAYYWYSKCTRGPLADRARKALRVLLADD
jgi:hypothetical protein